MKIFGGHCPMGGGGALVLGVGCKLGLDDHASLKILTFGHTSLPNRSITMGAFGFIRMTGFSIFDA